MISYYTSVSSRLEKINSHENGCWVSMINPSNSELQEMSAFYEVDTDTLKAALDTYERSRIETDDNYTMILVNIPTIEEHNEKELYTTIPLSIIVTKEAVITVCSEDTPILRHFTSGKVRDFYTYMKSRFILQVLYRTATLYLQYLSNIDRKSDEVENKLHKSTKNHELIELLKLEKSLVYFTTALRSNEAVLEKLFRYDVIKKYPDDSDLLDDVIVENKQAIEMANIYSGILSGMMDAFASVISNNLNIVMKVLAIITVVMAIPTMVFSAFGMNVNIAAVPYSQSPWSFAIIVAVSIILSLAVLVIFRKAKLFK
ncbi:MAG: magnesium transporter CorA family protein [Oscillospiraceae bacterium]|nr:magnesium transporter CorA family protein [Oscillospiraceae bacterium]